MIFLRCIETGAKNVDLDSATPFVSRECLSGIVTAYLDGKYPELDIDKLYPFLADEDIKRIFNHIIGESNSAT